MDRTPTLPIDERLVRIDTTRRRSRHAAAVEGAGGGARQRQQPRQLTQLLCGAYPQRGRIGDIADRPVEPNEEAFDRYTARLRFNIGLPTNWLVSATDWLADRLGLPIGYFGASTGAAAALVAATRRPTAVAAIVARGGRPDLAGAALRDVRAPTLLIVGGHDVEVIELNRIALQELRCEKQLVIVPGATHLFEEPGALDEVAGVARAWFERHLTSARWDATGTAD